MAAGRPAGLRMFTMDYQGVESVCFNWLHIDFPSLAQMAEAARWEARLLEMEEDGHYLCRLVSVG